MSYITEISKKAVQTISVKILVSVILIKLLPQYEVKELNCIRLTSKMAQAEIYSAYIKI